MTTKKSTSDDAPDEVESTEDTATPSTSPKPDKAIVEQVVDKERGKYEAEMVGDSTLIIRYADGSEDSFTVDQVTR